MYPLWRHVVGCPYQGVCGGGLVTEKPPQSQVTKLHHTLSSYKHIGWLDICNKTSSAVRTCRWIIMIAIFPNILMCWKWRFRLTLPTSRVAKRVSPHCTYLCAWPAWSACVPVRCTAGQNTSRWSVPEWVASVFWNAWSFFRYQVWSLTLVFLSFFTIDSVLGPSYTLCQKARINSTRDMGNRFFWK